MADDMREARVEKIFTDAVKRTGGKAYKWTSPGNAGVPDRIVIFPDRKPMFVELKTSKGRLTKLQKAQLKKLEYLGQKVDVLYGIKGVTGFFFRAGYRDIAEELARKYGLLENKAAEGGDKGGIYSP